MLRTTDQEKPEDRSVAHHGYVRLSAHSLGGGTSVWKCRFDALPHVKGGGRDLGWVRVSFTGWRCSTVGTCLAPSPYDNDFTCPRPRATSRFSIYYK